MRISVFYSMTLNYKIIYKKSRQCTHYFNDSKVTEKIAEDKNITSTTMIYVLHFSTVPFIIVLSCLLMNKVYIPSKCNIFQCDDNDIWYILSLFLIDHILSYFCAFHSRAYKQTEIFKAVGT